MRWKSGDGRGGEGNLFDEGQEFPQVQREGRRGGATAATGRTALAETRGKEGPQTALSLLRLLQYFFAPPLSLPTSKTRLE